MQEGTLHQEGSAGIRTELLPTHVLSLPAPLVQAVLRGQWPAVAALKPSSKRSPLVHQPVCTGLAVLPLAAKRRPNDEAQTAGEGRCADSHRVAPTSETLQQLIRTLCDVGSTLTCPVAVASLQSVVLQLRAIDSSLHADVEEESKELVRGKPYRGCTLVRALLLSGMIRDNSKLKAVVRQSMQLAYSAHDVAADFMRRIDELPLPSAATLSRWSYVVDVAFMVCASDCSCGAWKARHVWAHALCRLMQS